MAHAVVVADDHAIVLSGLAQLIGSDPGFVVVGTATDGQAAIEQVMLTDPDMVVLDLNMPRMSGLEVLRMLRERKAKQKFILLAASLSNSDVFDVAEAGVDGILLKEMAASTLMECLHQVAAGGQWLPDELVMAAVNSEGQRRNRWRELSALLTQREVQIVGLALDGLPNKEIAARLGISEGTTKLHLNSIYRKVGVSSRAGLSALVDGTR